MANTATSVPTTAPASLDPLVTQAEVTRIPRRPQLQLPVFKILVYLALTLGAFAFVLPFLWMASTSLMTPSEVARGRFVPRSRFVNFSAVSDADWQRPLGEFLPPTAEIRFRGSSITLYYNAHPDGAIFDVLVDGQRVTSVDSYSPALRPAQTLVIDAYPTVPTFSLTQRLKLPDSDHTLTLVFSESASKRPVVWIDRAVARRDDGSETTYYTSDFALAFGKWESVVINAETGRGEAVGPGVAREQVTVRAANLGFPDYLQDCCRAVIQRSSRFQRQALSEYIRLERPSGSHSNITTDLLPFGLNKTLGLSHRYVVTGSFSHYVKAWTDEKFGKAFVRTAVITLSSVSLQTLFAIMAAYAFGRMQFPGRDLLFFAFLMTLFVPFMVLLVPNLLTVTAIDKWSLRHIGPVFEKIGDVTGTIPVLGRPNTRWAAWIDSLPGLVVPFLGSTFSIFLLRQFFIQIPGELWDAARIDGAGHLRFLFQIVVPISKAAITTVALFSFIGTWDQLDWPILVTTSERWRPIAYALYNYRNEEGDNPQLLMAGAVIALLPVMIAYLLAQRQFTEGIATTGLKG